LAKGCELTPRASDDEAMRFPFSCGADDAEVPRPRREPSSPGRRVDAQPVLASPGRGRVPRPDGPPAVPKLSLAALAGGEAAADGPQTPGSPEVLDVRRWTDYLQSSEFRELLDLAAEGPSPGEAADKGAAAQSACLPLVPPVGLDGRLAILRLPAPAPCAPVPIAPPLALVQGRPHVLPRSRSASPSPAERALPPLRRPATVAAPAVMCSVARIRTPSPQAVCQTLPATSQWYVPLAGPGGSVVVPRLATPSSHVRAAASAASGWVRGFPRSFSMPVSPSRSWVEAPPAARAVPRVRYLGTTVRCVSTSPSRGSSLPRRSQPVGSTGAAARPQLMQAPLPLPLSWRLSTSAGTREGRAMPSPAKPVPPALPLGRVGGAPSTQVLQQVVLCMDLARSDRVFSNRSSVRVDSLQPRVRSRESSMSPRMTRGFR